MPNYTAFMEILDSEINDCNQNDKINEHILNHKNAL